MTIGNKFWQRALLLTLICLAATGTARATAGEEAAEITDGDCVYRLYDVSGAYLTCRAGRMYPGDEYIAGDNRHYRISRVDDAACAAYGEIVTDDAGDVSAAYLAEFSSLWSARAEKGDKGLICMYSTHSDESYVPGDGSSSKWKNAGIYDVGEAFREELEKRGYRVIYSDETFLPHDTGAYARSASTAQALLKKSPEALFDLHRDGVPAEEYETEVEGEEISKVRLFVGRSNANREANLAFAKQIKKAADAEYPGLVKDIYMGKGNYNQELYPQALLLEFGTHEIEKDKVMESTGYMAKVVDQVLGGTASAEKDAGETKGSAKAIVWVIVLAVAAAGVYALAATGRMGDIWGKMKRSLSEITGGSAGKRK